MTAKKMPINLLSNKIFFHHQIRFLIQFNKTKLTNIQNSQRIKKALIFRQTTKSIHRV